jgi:hypothetical protein
MTNSIVNWTIQLPVPITNSVLIRITSTGANLPFTASGTCVIYTQANSTSATSVLPFSCNFASSFTEINYTLTINQALLQQSAYLIIYHYGMTTLSSNSSVSVNVICYSLATTTLPGSPQIIFQALTSQATQTIPWNVNYIGSTSLTLSGFTSITSNSGVVSPFNLTFSLINKGLYNT